MTNHTFVVNCTKIQAHANVAIWFGRPLEPICDTYWFEWAKTKKLDGTRDRWLRNT